MFYDDEGGLKFCIVEVYKDAYLVSLNLPSKDTTLEEYEKWKNEYTHNAISLNDDYIPQSFKNSDIKELFKFYDVVEEVMDEYKLSVSDVQIPFIGGIIGFDFRELLTYLYDKSKEIKSHHSRGMSAWDCRFAIRDFMKEVLSKIDPVESK